MQFRHTLFSRSCSIVLSSFDWPFYPDQCMSKGDARPGVHQKGKKDHVREGHLVRVNMIEIIRLCQGREHV